MPATDTVPLYQPYLGPEVQEAATAALQEGWLGLGPLVERFEAELARFLELTADRHVVTTSSCTAALHLSSVLAGVGPGDEVICPAFTYVAGHQAVSATGATVVFADIEERTLGIDPEAARALVTPRTKAVMGVHFAGMPFDSDGLYAVAAEHGLRVIEDAAHAFGSRDRGTRVGASGDLVCFSFGPVKNITTLEGGAVVTPDPEDVQRLHELRLIGVTADTGARYARGRMWEYDVVRQGYRYHLGSVPAAIGLAQLAKAEVMNANRRRYCAMYDERFADVPGVSTLGFDWSGLAPYIYVVRLDEPQSRPELMARLKERGVASGIHFTSAHRYSYYAGNPRDELRVTERVSASVLTLPLHPFMDEGTIDRVVSEVRAAAGAKRRTVA